jgi:hypothetical protein
MSCSRWGTSAREDTLSEIIVFKNGGSFGNQLRVKAISGADTPLFLKDEGDNCTATDFSFNIRCDVYEVKVLVTFHLSDVCKTLSVSGNRKMTHSLLGHVEVRVSNVNIHVRNSVKLLCSRVYA